MFLALVLRLLASGMLFYGLSDHPYVSSALMRILICAVAVYCVFLANSERKSFWVLVFAAIFVLFNPVIPIHLNRQMWSVSSIASGSLLLLSLFFVRTKKTGPPVI